jgi:hypothetical protein
MKRKWFILLLCLILLGCGARLRYHTLSLNENDFLPYQAKGNSKIVGQAFLKTRGGDVKYGAGNDVALVPFTPYIEERYKALIDNVFMENPDSRYYKYVRTTRADGQGNFEFNEVPKGEYLLVCNIFWEIGGSYPQTTGGTAYTKTAVKPGETIKVVLTR